LGDPARASGCDGLLLRCQHLSSLLIHLLHRLGPLLQSLGLRSLSCSPLLLLSGLSLSSQCSPLFGCPLQLRSSLSLCGLDRCLLLLKLLPRLGSGLCFVPAPAVIPAPVSMIPVWVPILAANPIAVSTDKFI